MPDIALKVAGIPLGGMPVFDVELTEVPDVAGDVARDVTMDASLNTAVYISLFTDGRVPEEEATDKTDLRGWWGDEFGPIGSRLWELIRGKATDEAMNLAQTSAQDALRWLTEAGIAESVSVQVSRIGLYAIWMAIQIKRPGDLSSSFRYSLNWAATVN